MVNVKDVLLHKFLENSERISCIFSGAERKNNEKIYIQVYEDNDENSGQSESKLTCRNSLCS